MSEKLRVAVIGCGGIGRFHAEALREIDGCEAVATCDISPERAREVAELSGIPRAVGSVAELLEEVRPDAVTISTQHKTHPEVAIQCAEAGVHAIVEKPLSESVADGRRMVEAAERNGTVLACMFQRRFFPAVRRIKEAIEAGRIGAPMTAEVVAHLSRGREYFDATPWRGTWEGEGGGALMNQTIHMVDLLQWFMGSPPVEVYGRWATLRHGDYIDVEDTAVATVEFENGALATLQASTAIEPQFGFRVTMHGTNGHTLSLLENPEMSQATVDLWTFPGEEEQRAAWEREELGHFAFPGWHAVALEDFTNAVRTGHPPMVSGAEALVATEIIQAVYTSQRTRLPVALGPQAVSP